VKGAGAARGRGTPPGEWAVAAVGAALLAAAVGYLVFLAATEAEGPPELTIRSETVQAAGAGWLVGFVVVNAGPEAAAAVRVRGRLLAHGVVAEESRADLDYVPQRSERRGGLMFGADPGRHRLDLRVEGFAEP
jgi:uncharacterized protein (TIGR02588 family)